MPISWQGWAVSLVFIALLGLIAFRFGNQPLVIIALLVPLTVVLIVITAKTTRGGWRPFRPGFTPARCTPKASTSTGRRLAVSTVVTAIATWSAPALRRKRSSKRVRSLDLPPR